MTAMRSIVAALLLLVFAASARATDYPVSNASELTTALGTAIGGDTITLADGGYGSFTFTQNYGSYVTIRAANALAADFTGQVVVTGASYIEFDGIHINLSSDIGDSQGILEIDNSDHITFKNGELNGTVGGTYTSYVIYAHSDTSYTNFTNNYIHDGRFGGYIHGDEVVFSENTIDHVRNIAVLFNYATNLTVVNNMFEGHFNPAGEDHGDFIWSNGTDGALYSGNVMLLRPGSLSYIFQGIYFNNGSSHTDFEISNNLVSTNAVGGIILVNSGLGLVEKNTVLRAWNDPNTSSDFSDIVIQDQEAAITVRDNIVAGNGYGTGGFEAQWTDDQAANYYNDIYLDAMAGINATIEDFEPVPGGGGECGSGVGAEERICALLGGAPAVTGHPSTRHNYTSHGGFWQ